MSLIIYDESAFKVLCKEEIVYISVTEYAALHQRSRALIKKLCSEGRIPGAEKHSAGWMIPSNAPYPKRKKRETISSEK